LTCAYRLQKLGFNTLVLERGDRIGGVIRTERINGHLIEFGPSSLLPTAHTHDLLKEFGLDEELLEADPKAPRYIVVNGQLRAIPSAL
jgi:oxygen-dependent protoporphyrinogen oxidase